MLDTQTQQYIDQQVQQQVTSILAVRDRENASQLRFDPITGRATTGLNVYGAFGEQVFHNMIRLTPTEQTITSGVIKASSSSILISTESSASSDDLDTIEPAPLVYAGEEIIMLRAKDDADTVVVKSGTGNIICNGDFSLDDVNDCIWLRWDKLQAKWIELFRQNANQSAWNTYSPVITATTTNPAGTTNTGMYTNLGGIVHFRANILFAAANFGVGDYRISLPVTAHADAYVKGAGITMGNGFALDTSANLNYNLGIRIMDGTTCAPLAYQENTAFTNARDMSHTNIFTVASADEITVFGMYKSAV